MQLGWGRPLSDGLMDVSVQLREYRDEFLLMSRFIIAQPLHKSAYIGIIGEAGRLTVAFIKIALHREHLLQALPWSAWEAILHRLAGLQCVPGCPSKRPEMFVDKSRMLGIVAGHNFEPPAELLIGDRWDNLQDLHGETMLSSSCLGKPGDQLDVLIGA